MVSHKLIWAVSWQNQQNGMCVQRRLIIWAATWQNQQVTVHPAKTWISLGIRPVWSESSLSSWRKLGSLATHWVHREDSDQTGWMPRLKWGCAGCTVILLVLSRGGSYYVHSPKMSLYLISVIQSLCRSESKTPRTGYSNGKSTLKYIFFCTICTPLKSQKFGDFEFGLSADKRNLLTMSENLKVMHILKVLSM